MRAIDKALRKGKIMVNTKTETILTLESLELIHQCCTYIGWKYISSGRFGQTFCGMGRVPNGVIPFCSMENVFPVHL